MSVEPLHLFRCRDEYMFHYNGSKLTETGRLSPAVAGIVGKRITLADLAAKMLGAPEPLPD